MHFRWKKETKHWKNTRFIRVDIQTSQINKPNGVEGKMDKGWFINKIVIIWFNWYQS